MIENNRQSRYYKAISQKEQTLNGIKLIQWISVTKLLLVLCYLWIFKGNNLMQRCFIKRTARQLPGLLEPMYGNNSVSCSTNLSFHDVDPRISCSYRYLKKLIGCRS